MLTTPTTEGQKTMTSTIENIKTLYNEMNDIYDKFTNSQTDSNSYSIFTQPIISLQTTITSTISCSLCLIDTSITIMMLILDYTVILISLTFYIHPSTVVVIKKVTALIQFASTTSTSTFISEII
ncbi:hypothetical protein Glove_168g194 [Diversispora epigaea]|uniref:Uncharacterized protein n=1 Tax=Diversispora epigaea TaxID=1348612 RepID=A0A397IYA6_9GLOM|nr:hypothetical protein Glove_168g194 [Diversispora epigaea]